MVVNPTTKTVTTTSLGAYSTVTGLQLYNTLSYNDFFTGYESTFRFPVYTITSTTEGTLGYVEFDTSDDSFTEYVEDITTDIDWHSSLSDRLVPLDRYTYTIQQNAAYAEYIELFCNKPAYSITQKSITSITKTGFSSGVDLSGTGRYYTEAGVCYKLASSAGDPTTSDSKSSTTSTFGTASVAKTLSGLTQSELYKSRGYIIDGVNGTTYTTPTITTKLLGFKDPENAYTSDDDYAVASSTTADFDIQLSINNGSTWSSTKTETLPTGSASEDEVILGSKSDTWGLSLDGGDLVDGKLVVRIATNVDADNNQEYHDFGFTVSSGYTITGVEVKVEGYWDDSTEEIYLDWIAVRIYYGNLPTPVIEGSMAYASDGRKNGEGAGNGTGVAVFWDGDNWIAVDSGAQVDD